MIILSRSSRPALVSALIVLTALAGCSRDNQDGDDAVADRPEPVLRGNPVMTQAPDGSPMTPGEWDIGEDASGAHARFAVPGNEPVFAMECDAVTQSLTLSRADASPDAQAYVLEASGQRARVDMEPTRGALPMQRAAINKEMPLFAAFSNLGTVITVTGDDGETLRLPGAPGIRRVIEACSR